MANDNNPPEAGKFEMHFKAGQSAGSLTREMASINYGKVLFIDSPGLADP